MNREELVGLRKRLGLRSIRVAQMANIDRARLSMWENGHVEITQKEIERISAVLAQELRLIRELSIPMPQAVMQ